MLLTEYVTGVLVDGRWLLEGGLGVRKLACDDLQQVLPHSGFTLVDILDRIIEVSPRHVRHGRSTTRETFSFRVNKS